MSINQEWMAERRSKMLAALEEQGVIANGPETLNLILEQCAMVAGSQYFGSKAAELLRSMKSK